MIAEYSKTPSNSNANDRPEPIAVIGIGCRFPGGIKNPNDFWQFLVEGQDAITEVPADRFPLDDFFDEIPATPGKVMTRWGGFLESIDQFDATFFEMSPREAERLDPAQRLLLETAWEALEDAGQVPNTDALIETGVFVGLWLSDFEARLFKDPRQTDFYMTTGSGRYTASGRLSYAFGFQGPSVTLDTACSSSLVAVHLACQSLRTRECNLALAGAANIILQPHITIAYSQSKMMAPDGRCKFGDAQADGYVRSEGAATVALKRLADAQADGDLIYAVILGSAVNNDGRSSGFLTTPGGAGQEDLLRKAYRNAGVSPGLTQYIEAHGPGTRAGDPVEIKALGAVLSEDRPEGLNCTIGSVKTNFGHTEGVAGLAGLIKLTLSLHNKTIPASLHYKTPNPGIPWEQIPLKIQSTLSPWPVTPYPKLGGVSAFGIAGTNAHLVLQGIEHETISRQDKPASPNIENDYWLLPLSARTPEALVPLAEHYRDFISSSESTLYDICFNAALHRKHHDYRFGIVANSTHELIAELKNISLETIDTLVPKGQSSPRKVLFIFPGQGSQWIGMGRQLYDGEQVFHQMIDQCDQAFSAVVDWSLVEMLHADEKESRLRDIDVIQPMLFAIQIALAAQWRSWGVDPEGVIGHSMGEVASACVAGSLSLQDAARVICQRSHLMKRVSGKGAMAVVDMTFDQAQQAIQGHEDQISIAVNNSPSSTVLSGNPNTIDFFIQEFQNQNIFCRQVKVDVAAHSPHMDAIRPELVQNLRELQAHSSNLVMYSTVTGTKQAGNEFDADYWGRNLREPVRFSSAVQEALTDGFNTFIEISPHPILLQPVEQGIQAFKQNSDEFLTLPSFRRDENERRILLNSFNELYIYGYTQDWTRIYPLSTRRLRLPTYPWQREYYWLDSARDSRFSQDPIVIEDPSQDDWMYSVQWKAASREKSSSRQEPSKWLIVGTHPLADALKTQIKNHGHDCEVLTTFDAPSRFDNIVFLPHENQHVFELQKLVASLSQLSSPPRLFVVTRGAQPISRQLAAADLKLSLYWGFGKVLSEEHPDFWGGCIDVDPALPPEKAAALLLPEFELSNQETQIAIYNEQRYVARLERLPAPTPVTNPWHWRQDAAYLITGGLGGIGLNLAKRLAEQGVRRLILMGRTPLPPRSEWLKTNPESPTGRKIAAIRAIESIGASVHLAYIDVANSEQLSSFLDQYQREGWPEIRGVFHTAGITQDSFIVQMTKQELDEVLHPKVEGSWLLHQHLPNLDLFVMFSSIGAILGQVGQGSYAAANAYMDALANYRRAIGLPALSINWGAWQALGLLTTTGGQVVAKTLEDQGIRSFDVESGLNALFRLVSRGDIPPQVAVFPADWTKFHSQRKGTAQARFTSELKEGTSSDQSISTEHMRTKLQSLEPKQRIAQLEVFLQQQVAQILKLPPNRIVPHKPLGTMGLDSLMTIELRNRLEKSLGIMLSATFVWNYPTIHAMAPFIAEKMGFSLKETEEVSAPAEKTTSSKIGDENLEEVMAQLDTLSDDDALEALLGNKP